MVKIKLAKVEVLKGCEKPQCGKRYTHRHHTHNERFILMHFRNRKSRKYDLFVARYQSFDPRDWRRICPEHHEEIHERYDRIIRKHIRRNHYKPIEDWTWKQAKDLMKDCHRYCMKWLHSATPGIKTAKRVRH
jgi:hypothetical protein